MQRLDTLRFKRNIYGYEEETCVSIYLEHVHGLPLYVVYPHHNDEHESWVAQRHGRYTFNYIHVNSFMQVFRDSWRTGYPMELSEDSKWYTREKVYELAYEHNNTPDDPYVYRLIVREKYWEFFKEQFVVDSMYGDAEYPAIRSLIGRPDHARYIQYTQELSSMVAVALSCIHVNTQWTETIRKLFHDPEIVIQRAKKRNCRDSTILAEHWSDVRVEKFVDHQCELRFNGDFTDVTIYDHKQN